MQSTYIDTLPDDPDQLKALLLKQAAEIKLLQEQLNLALHHRFGKTSEKHPGQHELFDEPEDILEASSDPADEVSDDDAIEAPSHPRKTRGRKALPEHLPRVDVIRDLHEADKICDHDGHVLHKIGEEISEQLEIIPAQIRVIRNIRIKYGCRVCETGVKSAPMPAQLIPKSMATSGLLAYVAVSKYADALPLYRQEQMFKRIGVDISRATLAFWMVQVGKALGPIIALLEQTLLSGDVIHMDETPVQVLNEPHKRPESQSYMWVRMGGSTDHPIVLFDYDPSRSSKVPIRLLDGFEGHLMTDAYAGYGAVTKHAITGIGCWTHARRKFMEAVKVQGKSKATGKAQLILNDIQKLYVIERQIAEKCVDERLKIRQARAKPILDKMKIWLDKSLHQVPPKSALGKALNYLANEWPRLIHYVGDGRLPIDNNPCENAIRPFVIGRKNWLFSHSQAGAKASANIYSIIETAKRSGHEPWHYLNYLLEKLPATNEADLHDLLPHKLAPITFTTE